MDINITENKPKKRGRKPKNKSLEHPPDSEVIIKVPKKRGRKAKVKDNIEEVQLPRKRGRKPKINKETVEYQNKVNSDNLILHLPIDFNNEEYVNPEPYDDYISYTKIDKNHESESNMINKIDFEEYIKSREIIINNSKDLFYEYIESNKKKKWPSYTNINCLWDCQPFDNMPFGIPIKKTQNHIEMFGNFCSPECAAAYCFSLNDNVWERYSLLNEIYSNGEPIKIANSKLLLKKFGGIYTVNEYRNLNINNSKKYNICLPPILAYIPILEETLIDIDENILVNKNSIKKINNYKLQRKKQVTDENSLENIMNLKYL